VSFTAIGAGGFSIALADTTAPIRFYTGPAPSERMRITAAGNVGINTLAAAPSPLTVNGAIFGNGPETNTVYNGGAGNNAAFIGPQGYWALRSNTNHAFNLDVYNSGAPTQAVSVLQNGFVGLGTANTNAKLYVAGGNPFRAVWAQTGSAGEAVHGDCLVTNNSCYGIEGTAVAGTYPGVFVGGRGLYASSDDASSPGVTGVSFSTSSYGVRSTSEVYRSIGAFKNNTSFFTLFVDISSGEPLTNNIANIEAGLVVKGNLTVNGSKTGYVVDAMLNVDKSPLEPGDVVVIVGSSEPVHGHIPVVTVKKATAAYDTGVAGVVDQLLYVPDAATKAAYQAQQDAMRAAMAAAADEDKRARAAGTKPDYSGIAIPQITITDAQGTVHAVEDTSVPAGGYTNVVTLGSYKMIKADASFGAIQAGDLLTTSMNPGYAMKVTDKVAAIGAIVGKALGGLDIGTGTIPVLVMPK
jgi:hypothetical protein